MSAQCRSCGTEIIWCRTANDKRMPIDAAPSEHGDLLVSGRFVRKADQIELTSGLPLFVSHFATCPHHAAWRSLR